VARSHLNPEWNLEWADLFTGVGYTSSSRAQAFLWLCFHYLESNTDNPFADEFATNNPGLSPLLRLLTHEAAATENVDTSDELAWGVQMAEKRLEFLAKVQAEKEQEERDKAKAKERERERLVSGLTGGHPKSAARRASSVHPHPGSSSRQRKGKLNSSSRVERDGGCSLDLFHPALTVELQHHPHPYSPYGTMSWMGVPCRRTRIHRMGRITPDETRRDGQPQILIISLQLVGQGGRL
jgi:hypothetical protein